MTRRAIALVVAGATALAVAPADAGKRKKRKPPTRTVKVFDNYFLPAKLTVKRRTWIVWRWPADVGDVHDVKLIRAPKGVRKFQSEAASSAYSFRRTLTRPGTYRFLCTFHEQDGMAMTVRVRRR